MLLWGAVPCQVKQHTIQTKINNTLKYVFITLPFKWWLLYLTYPQVNIKNWDFTNQTSESKDWHQWGELTKQIKNITLFPSIRWVYGHSGRINYYRGHYIIWFHRACNCHIDITLKYVWFSDFHNIFVLSLIDSYQTTNKQVIKNAKFPPDKRITI